MRIQWDFRHTLVMVATTLVAATAGFIEQQDAATLLAALQDWSALKVMLGHVALIDLIAIAALFKQSPIANGGGGGSTASRAQAARPGASSRPPANLRAVTCGAFAVALCSFAPMAPALFVATAPALLTGCPGAIPAVIPVAELLACVAQHALNGEGLGQIANACKTDVPSVIASLLDARQDPRVRQTVAYGEVMRTKSIFVNGAAE